jgi:hypothetical protein
MSKPHTFPILYDEVKTVIISHVNISKSYNPIIKKQNLPIFAKE